jgi:transcriptional regulator with XRE-family HTH domain
MPTDFAQRLRRLINEFGSRYALAKASGIPQSTLQGYEAGSKPGMDALARLARVGNVDLNWLLNGTGEMRPAGILSGAAFADILMVPQYELSTALSMEMIIAQVPFSRFFLEQNLKLRKPSYDSLLVIEAGADLYQIRRGDLVLVDRTQTKATPDGVYLLNLPGLELRGLFLFPEDKVNVVGPQPPGSRSDRGRTLSNSNSASVRRAELFALRRGTVSKVVGRAVWVGRAI